MHRPALVVASATTLLLSLACGSGSVDEAQADPVPAGASDEAAPDEAAPAEAGSAGSEPAPASNLRPASELSLDCFGWPEQPWTRRNAAGRPSTLLDRGDAAVDFTLKDRAGAEHTLSALLQDKPVLLVQGSYTCPRYQENEPGLSQTASKFADDLHTVLVYNVEAHPKTDPTPYHGDARPKEFSDRDQPTDYETRVEHAGDLELSDDVLVLVDALEPGASNPVWCTYGHCPSCSWLIRQDGTIEAVHLWHDQPSMESSIDALLGR